MTRVFPTTFAILLLAGCMSTELYDEPTTSTNYETEKTVSSSENELWEGLIPAIGREFFVINNLDKDSGLINVSYTGSPAEFVDCGQITIKGPDEASTVTFAGSQPRVTYPFFGGAAMPGQVQRTMELEGRVNLIVEDTDEGGSKLTANARYVLTKRIVAQNPQGLLTARDEETITFNSNAAGTFSAGTTCVPNGSLERRLLDLAG